MKVDSKKYVIFFLILVCFISIDRFFISYDIKCIDLLDCLHLLIDWSVEISYCCLNSNSSLNLYSNILHDSILDKLRKWHIDSILFQRDTNTLEYWDSRKLGHWHSGINVLATVRSPFVNAGSMKYCKYFKF